MTPNYEALKHVYDGAYTDHNQFYIDAITEYCVKERTYDVMCKELSDRATVQSVPCLSQVIVSFPPMKSDNPLMAFKGVLIRKMHEVAMENLTVSRSKFKIKPPEGEVAIAKAIFTLEAELKAADDRSAMLLKRIKEVKEMPSGPINYYLALCEQDLKLWRARQAIQNKMTIFRDALHLIEAKKLMEQLYP